MLRCIICDILGFHGTDYRDTRPCSVVEVDRRFIAFMMVVVRTSETSVYLRHYIPRSCHLQDVVLPTIEQSSILNGKEELKNCDTFAWNIIWIVWEHTHRMPKNMVCLRRFLMHLSFRTCMSHTSLLDLSNIILTEECELWSFSL
jgi:hypothetical protein